MEAKCSACLPRVSVCKRGDSLTIINQPRSGPTSVQVTDLSIILPRALLYNLIIRDSILTSFFVEYLLVPGRTRPRTRAATETRSLRRKKVPGGSGVHRQSGRSQPRGGPQGAMHLACSRTRERARGASGASEKLGKIKAEREKRWGLFFDQHGSPQERRRHQTGSKPE